jgi:ApeA N-terminal domain 1
MTIAETFTKFGKFVIAPGKELLGELHVAGKNSLLYVRDDERFDPHVSSDGCITGVLHDLTKVTLLNCINLTGMGYASRNNDTYYHAKIFPHFVLEGQRHLGTDERIISEVTFKLEDGTDLFYDFDAFGSVIDARPHINGIATANGIDRPVPIGPEPKIVYFAGKREILWVDTILGQVRVEHNPSWCLPDPRGVRIDNFISISIDMPEAVRFDEAITRTLRLLRFLESIIGRPQNLPTVFLRVDESNSERLKVHWSHRPEREGDSGEGGRSPHPADMLLMPVEDPEEFCQVMQFWFKNDEERQDARGRFHTSFAMQRTYTVERLVASANMFDILPKSAAPQDIVIPAELSQAKTECQKVFKRLPESYERNSVLGALGRIGKASLKHKTRHRGQIIMDAFGGRPADLLFVLDAAVDCRNHYVHGTPSRIDYSEDSDVMVFLTNTLEFVFGASELVEAGWNIQRFASRGSTLTHPFGSYLVSYKSNLESLKTLLKH